MTIEHIKHNKTMMCDNHKCTEFLENSDFMSLISVSKEDGWFITKDQDGKWRHYCPSCKPKPV